MFSSVEVKEGITIKKTIKRFLEWHSWIDYKNSKFLVRWIAGSFVMPVLMFIFFNPLDIQYFPFQERIIDPLGIRMGIVTSVAGVLFVTIVAFCSEVESQKFVHQIRKQRQDEEDEKEAIWKYINNSEHRTFVNETPDSLRGALAYILWLRYMQISDNNLTCEEEEINNESSRS